MKLTTTCLECLLRRNLDTARRLGDEDTAMAFAREYLAALSDAPEWASAPHFSPIAADLFAKYYGLPLDRFAQEKERSNRFALARLEQLRTGVESAPDPVYGALQMAVLGNYLDFSALGDGVDFDVLADWLTRSRDIRLEENAYARFRQDLARGKRLLYLTDNAGEIVFDRLTAETIQKAYPQLSITFCVRGGPAVNDATRADAAEAGVTFPVIDNGSRISGTELPSLGQEARQALEAADVILAKGQGNTETMFGCGYNVYYLFLVKCQRFVDAFHQSLMTPMLVRERKD